MANPQKENGYTAIANELYDVVVRTPLPGRHLRVWLFILRKTYGWGKKSDRISLSQLKKCTYIDRSSLCKIVKNLVAWKTIHKNKSVYKINKNYDEWLVARAPRSGVEDNRLVARAPHTKETITKETNIHASPNGSRALPMKTYDERKSDIDYLPQIDAETGEPILNPKRTGVGKTMQELLKWATKRRGGAFLGVGKQYKAMKMMRLAGIGPDEVKNRWLTMEDDRFYKEHGFDFMDVANSFNKKP